MHQMRRCSESRPFGETEKNKEMGMEMGWKWKWSSDAGTKANPLFQPKSRRATAELITSPAQNA